MASKNRKPGRRRRAKAQAEADGLRVQGDLLASAAAEEDIDRGKEEVIPVVFVGDLADEMERGILEDPSGVSTDPDLTVADDDPEVEEVALFEEPAAADRERDYDPVDAPTAEDERLRVAAQTAREGRMQEAVRLYIEILIETPYHFEAQFGLGTLYDDLGRPELAIERFLAASELDPDNAQVRASLGAAYGAVGRFEDADTELQLALRPRAGECGSSSQGRALGVS